MSKIIFTDLDGTLTLRDTYLKFLLKNLTPYIFFKNAPILVMMIVNHILKKIDDNEVKKITFKMLFYGYKQDIDISDFIKSIPWNYKVLDSIEKKRLDGYKVVIVTASPDVYVKNVCDYLKYDDFISTKTMKQNDCLTGAFDGEICNFEEKPKRIKEFMSGRELEHSISYGNSSGDFEMLKFCDESYFVNKKNIKRFEGR